MTTVHGYHGTPEAFDIKDMYKPAYFGKSIETAKGFTGENGRIIKATITAEKILEFDADSSSWGSIWTGIEDVDNAVWDYIVKSECYDKEGNIIEEEMEYWEDNGPTLNFIVSWASEQGYDLVIVHDVYDDTSDTCDDNYIALNGAVITMNSDTISLTSVKDAV